MEQVALLGATGTIGDNTLDVIRRHPEKYRLHSATAQKNVEKMLQICKNHQPEYVVMADAGAAEQLQTKLTQTGSNTRVGHGTEALERAAASGPIDTVVAAIVGAAGLLPTLAAARAGKKILLANKEALVMSGALFVHTVESSQAVLLPLDSEHNAIFQCLPYRRRASLRDMGVARLHLTASGGPFRCKDINELQDVTPEQACAHPNWVMGRKISVDSASMMNKGLEVIEASWLFRASANDINVVIHPQSIIHSLVEYVDGSFLAQMGQPDMRVPIAHALAWPDRMESGASRLDLTAISELRFEKVDYARFPCLRLAEEALRQGGTATTVLNAANEAAVDAFLNKSIRFTDIARCIEHALQEIPDKNPDDLQTILHQDQESRRVSLEWIRRRQKGEARL